MTTKPNYYLITSSSLFFVPMLVGIYKGHRILPMFTLVSTCASISYWINPIPGTRLYVDLVTSKTSGVVYFLYGILYLESTQLKVIGWIDLFLLILSYQGSCSFYNSPHHYLWIPCHMMFHYFSALGQILVL